MLVIILHVCTYLAISHNRTVVSNYRAFWFLEIVPFTRYRPFRFLLEVLRVCVAEVRNVWYLRDQLSDSHGADQQEDLLITLAHQLMLTLVWMTQHGESYVSPRCCAVMYWIREIFFRFSRHIQYLQRIIFKCLRCN